jgi:hypothetical protein
MLQAEGSEFVWDVKRDFPSQNSDCGRRVIAQVFVPFVIVVGMIPASDNALRTNLEINGTVGVALRSCSVKVVSL